MSKNTKSTHTYIRYIKELKNKKKQIFTCSGKGQEYNRKQIQKQIKTKHKQTQGALLTYVTNYPKQPSNNSGLISNHISIP